MAVAIGTIEADGFPPTLAAADAMVKNGRVTLVGFEMAERARFFVTVRGPVSEVKRAVEAGILAGNRGFANEKVLAWYILPHPAENTVAVMPVEYSEKDVPFR
ncbi:MAG TPA: carbon dioxide-concentrating mechanism protein CcmK [Cyanobacteria bacterium UBA8156]|jgi:microcompartment protein CcmL/EutN|nr:carbon dioxide-concentrating mechanism protein CcmK [Cyanobacteria bacterium UBA8156]